MGRGYCQRGLSQSHTEYGGGNGEFSLLAFAGMRNLFLDEVRRRKRRPTEELTDRAAVPEDALATVLKKEKNRRLHRAMASLPAQYEQILLLYYFAGLSVKQIATLQGISDTAVKTALFRARVRLRKEWEAEGYDL